MSYTRGPVGRDPFAPPSNTTPGPLGHNDPPNHPITPGPTGFNDPYDPAYTLKTEVHSSSPGAVTFITINHLQAIFDKAGNEYLRQIVNDLNGDLQKYRLDSALRRAHFFAQVREEAGAALRGRVESLNYSQQGLKNTFRYYREHPDEADHDGYVKDPVTKGIVRNANTERIANVAYGGRNGNGGFSTGDGWRYRGRGFIQVTGRGNYAAISRQYTALYGDNADFEISPEILERFPYTVRSAVCFWNLHKLYKLADEGAGAMNVDSITAVINRLTNSYESRRHHFVKAYGVFKA